MPGDSNRALAAYDRALGGEGLSGLEARDRGPDGGSSDFAEAPRRAAEDAIDVLRRGEGSRSAAPIARATLPRR